jgi:predicted polyphosphate/ATP-dependent NAD kinase
MKVIVTGGRTYDNASKIKEVLDNLNPTLIVQGGATGADALAKIYAEQNSIPFKTYQADWEKHGRSAGPIRNNIMVLENQDATVVAFPGGSGTRSCINLAKRFNLSIIEVPEE